jgi:hypothetical protein
MEGSNKYTDEEFQADCKVMFLQHVGVRHLTISKWCLTVKQYLALGRLLWNI